MTAFNGNVFSAHAQASQALIESAAALNQEMVRFAKERLQTDSRALSARGERHQ
ncbi:hypothetical protein BMS3Bbin10_02312 [bacterium BMS3Bbin10]|nr:hypothetical protein BMS3Bbin10_02312 [bacterium BMS3Bbin10]